MSVVKNLKTEGSFGMQTSVVGDTTATDDPVSRSGASNLILFEPVPSIILLGTKGRGVVKEALRELVTVAVWSGWERQQPLVRLLGGDDMSPKFPLPHPVPHCLGIICLGDFAKRGERAELSAWWKVERDEDPPILILDGSDDGVDVLRWVGGRLSRQMAVFATRNTTLHRDLKLLREMHAATQKGFSELELLANRHGVSGSWRALVIEPGGASVSLAGCAAGRHLRMRQALPCDSEGVSAIDLYVVRVASDARGTLTVRLSALDDGEEFGRWSRQYSQLDSGWNCFDLDRNACGPRRTLVVAIETDTEAGIALELGLGHKHPLQEFWLLESTRRAAKATLAVRIWRGIPGVQAGGIVAGDGSRHHAAPGRPLVLVGEDLAGAIQVSPARDPASMAPRLVEPVESGRALQVHPVPGDITVARLGPLELTGIRHIWADIRTEHEAAKTIEYAMYAGGESAWRKVMNGGWFASRKGFSSWISVAPNTASQIHVFLDPGLDGSAYLYLATRCPPPDDTAYAWARWQRIWFADTVKSENDG